jgi:hypothetical protein
MRAYIYQANCSAVPIFYPTAFAVMFQPECLYQINSSAIAVIHKGSGFNFLFGMMKPAMPHPPFTNKSHIKNEQYYQENIC